MWSGGMQVTQYGLSGRLDNEGLIWKRFGLKGGDVVKGGKMTEEVRADLMMLAKLGSGSLCNVG